MYKKLADTKCKKYQTYIEQKSLKIRTWTQQSKTTYQTKKTKHTYLVSQCQHKQAPYAAASCLAKRDRSGKGRTIPNLCILK